MYSNKLVCVLLVTLLFSQIIAEKSADLNVKVAVHKTKNICGDWQHIVRVETPRPYEEYDIQVEHKRAESGVVVETIITEQRPGACHINIVDSGSQLNDGYVQLQDFGMYKRHPAANWTQAKRVCESEDASLTVLSSQQEAEMLLRTFNNIPKHGAGVCYDSLWVGITDAQQEGNFLTIFGDSLSNIGYSRWSEGEPNGGTYENCGSLYYGGALNDCPCNIDLVYFCKKEK